MNIFPIRFVDKQSVHFVVSRGFRYIDYGYLIQFVCNKMHCRNSILMMFAPRSKISIINTDFRNNLTVLKTEQRCSYYSCLHYLHRLFCFGNHDVFVFLWIHSCQGFSKNRSVALPKLPR